MFEKRNDMSKKPLCSKQTMLQKAAHFICFLLQFLRLARGTANELDETTRARGTNASMIEIPLEGEEQKDVYAENEELKVILSFPENENLASKIYFSFSGGNPEVGRSNPVFKNCWNAHGKQAH